MYNEMISGVIIFIVVCIALFFILRELNCWYWKINERVALMKENNELLRKLSVQLQGDTLNEEITVEEKKTGKVKKMTRGEYMTFLSKVKDPSGYVIVDPTENKQE